ncbi:MAG: hypothetical protein NTV58_05070 [Deltaproteobacteria bacterium]|nr:hypothetical protein [Deltaproteobacteria bacterium]
MGKKLVRIFEIVTEEAGVKGRLALATKTGISMAKAAEMSDTEELISKLKTAANEILDTSI